MALTKISTGGVKDDAASQAKIADEAVDEARLQISNAGTNGQFLSKQSGNTGGLTWADVTIPDADKVIEGNTSVEAVDTGSDGHVKVTLEGTERVRVDTSGMIGVNMTPQTTASSTYMLQMSSGGTQCFLSLGNNTSGVGPLNGLVIGNDGGHAYLHNRENTPLLLSTNDLERFRVGSAGQLGIAGANYGTSGQVLTSQGASSAPQWADAGGGAWEKLTSGTVSSGNTANITTTHLTSSYQLYRLTFDVRGSGDIEDVLYLQQYSNGAWQTSTYRVNYGQEGSYATNNSMAGLWLGNLSKRWLGTINFSEPYATDTSTFYRYDGFTNNDNGGSTANGSVQEHKAIKVGGGFNDNTATTGLRFLLSSGSNAFTRGWFLLEGCAIS